MAKKKGKLLSLSVQFFNILSALGRKEAIDGRRDRRNLCFGRIGHTRRGSHVDGMQCSQAGRIENLLIRREAISAKCPPRTKEEVKLILKLLGGGGGGGA